MRRVGRESWRRPWALVAAGAITAAIAVWALLAAGDGGRTTRATSPVVEPTAPATGTGEPRRPKRSGERRSRHGRDHPAAAPPPRKLATSRARRAYRDYVAAINRRDGDALCALVAPGFVRELRPPVRRGSCARRIATSIGHADARGFPVWKRTILSGFEAAGVGQERRVRLTAAIVTEFSDRDEPSVESDVAYLVPHGRRYRLAKATGALWRAVGKPDVPPEVIAPPPGF